MIQELPAESIVWMVTPPPVPAAALARRTRGRTCPPPIPPEARVAFHDGAVGDDVSVLVLAAQRGSQRAFTALVARYRPRVLALALHLTGSAADADDITQDVFLRVFQSLGDFEHRCAFYTWIYRISLNRSLQVLQKRRVRRSVNLDDPRVAIAVAVDAHDAPHRALELRETYAQLVYAFDQLSPLLRTTVVLCTLQGLSHAEVAAIFGTTEGTIAWRMHEAREQLRRTLAVLAQPVDAGQVARRLRVITGAQRTPRSSRAQSDDAADASSSALALALVSVVYA